MVYVYVLKGSFVLLLICCFIFDDMLNKLKNGDDNDMLIEIIGIKLFCDC